MAIMVVRLFYARTIVWYCTIQGDRPAYRVPTPVPLAHIAPQAHLALNGGPRPRQLVIATDEIVDAKCRLVPGNLQGKMKSIMTGLLYIEAWMHKS